MAEQIERYLVLRGTVQVGAEAIGPGGTVELPPSFAAGLLAGPSPFLAPARESAPSNPVAESAISDGEAPGQEAPAAPAGEPAKRKREKPSV